MWPLVIGLGVLALFVFGKDEDKNKQTPPGGTPPGGGPPGGIPPLPTPGGMVPAPPPGWWPPNFPWPGYVPPAQFPDPTAPGGPSVPPPAPQGGTPAPSWWPQSYPWPGDIPAAQWPNPTDYLPSIPGWPGGQQPGGGGPDYIPPGGDQDAPPPWWPPGYQWPPTVPSTWPAGIPGIPGIPGVPSGDPSKPGTPGVPLPSQGNVLVLEDMALGAFLYAPGKKLIEFADDGPNSQQQAGLTAAFAAAHPSIQVARAHKSAAPVTWATYGVTTAPTLIAFDGYVEGKRKSGVTVPALIEQLFPVS